MRLIQKPDNKSKAIAQTIPKAENNSKNDYDYNHNPTRKYQMKNIQDNKSSLVSKIWIKSLV